MYWWRKKHLGNIWASCQQTLISNIFSGQTFFLQFNMVCRNLCERLYSKIIFDKSHFEGGKKYCRWCEFYYCHNGVLCLCCALIWLAQIEWRMNPALSTMARKRGF
jgi:hypothetical protein